MFKEKVGQSILFASQFDPNQFCGLLGNSIILEFYLTLIDKFNIRQGHKYTPQKNQDVYPVISHLLSQFHTFPNKKGKLRLHKIWKKHGYEVPLPI
jgi:hypothetical protein